MKGKGTAAKGSKAKVRASTKQTVRRPSRVQRGRVDLQPVSVTSSFARWESASPVKPWDGQHLGAGLVDVSQLACECGECWGCQRRLG
jgi:hypothetical protein